MSQAFKLLGSDILCKDWSHIGLLIGADVCREICQFLFNLLISILLPLTRILFANRLWCIVRYSYVRRVDRMLVTTEWCAHASTLVTWLAPSTRDVSPRRHHHQLMTIVDKLVKTLLISSRRRLPFCGRRQYYSSVPFNSQWQHFNHSVTNIRLIASNMCVTKGKYF